MSCGDMGRGCDSMLGEIGGEVLMCGLENMCVMGGDRDGRGYDCGCYGCSRSYVSGKGVEKGSEEMRKGGGKKCVILGVSGGLDSKLMEGGGEKVGVEVDKVVVCDGSIGVVRNVRGEGLRKGEDMKVSVVKEG